MSSQIGKCTQSRIGKVHDEWQIEKKVPPFRPLGEIYLGLGLDEKVEGRTFLKATIY